MRASFPWAMALAALSGIVAITLPGAAAAQEDPSPFVGLWTGEAHITEEPVYDVAISGSRRSTNERSRLEGSNRVERSRDQQLWSIRFSQREEALALTTWVHHDGEVNWDLLYGKRQIEFKKIEASRVEFEWTQVGGGRCWGKAELDDGRLKGEYECLTPVRYSGQDRSITDYRARVRFEMEREDEGG